MDFVTRLDPGLIPKFIPLLDLPRIRLMETPLHVVTERQCVDLVIDALHRGRGGWVVTPNLDHLRRCTMDGDYAKTIRRADLCVPDGMPLIWASRLQGTPLPERVAGSNLIFSLSRALAQNAMSVFLLGGEPDTAKLAAQSLSRQFPGLKIAGTFCPDFGFEHEPAKLWDITRRLVKAQPNVVFVGLGSPKQEYLIFDLRSRLPKTWWIGIGVSFSFVCGRIRRAPRWMQQHGLEWVHRLYQEPRRLARRYLIDDLPFLFSLFSRSLGNRFADSPRWSLLSDHTQTDTIITQMEKTK